MASPAVDVLVVGAGPAGSAAAWRLARAGARVRILDASVFPRSKPCGDAVSPGAVPLLREMGVAGRLDRRAARLGGWWIRTHDGAWFEGRYREGRRHGTRGPGSRAESPAWGYALPRRELDALLLEAAIRSGAEFLPARRAFGLEHLAGHPPAVRVRARDPSGREESHAARLLLGADGLRSRVARLLGGVERGRRRRLGLVGRFADADGPSDRGELRFSEEGVLGWAPLGGRRCNVTVVVPASLAGSISSRPDDFYRERLRSYGVADRLSGARSLGPLEVTGPFEIAPRRTSARSALLLGDAAGYFDPTTGQGVYRALIGARWAAEAAIAMLERPAAAGAARRRYEARLSRLLGPGRRLQRVLDLVVGSPRLLGALGRVAAARPGLSDLLVDVTGDRAPAGALLDPRRLASALTTGRRGPLGEGGRELRGAGGRELRGVGGRRGRRGRSPGRGPVAEGRP